jgi:hypothetical protein
MESGVLSVWNLSLYGPLSMSLIERADRPEYNVFLLLPVIKSISSRTSWNLFFSDPYFPKKMNGQMSRKIWAKAKATPKTDFGYFWQLQTR